MRKRNQCEKPVSKDIFVNTDACAKIAPFSPYSFLIILLTFEICSINFSKLNRFYLIIIMSSKFNKMF